MPDAHRKAAPLSMGLADLVVAVRARWWAVLLMAVLGGGGAFTYARKQTPYYSASTKVLLYQDESTNLLSTPAGPTSVPSLAAIFGGGLPSHMELLRELVTSREIAARVMDRKNLLSDPRFTKHIGTPPPDRQTILSILSPLVQVEVIGIKATITFSWPDAELASALSLAYTEEAIEFFKQGASRTYRIVQGQFEEKQQTARAAQQALKDFEKRHGVPVFESQTQIELGQETSLNMQLITLDREYKELQTTYRYAVDPVEASSAKSRMKANREQRSRVAGELGRARRFMSRVPEQRLTYERLKKQAELAQTEYLAARQKVELLKAGLEQDLSRFTILDKPYAPTAPSRPQARRLLAFGLMGGLLLGMTLALLQEDLSRIRTGAPRLRGEAGGGEADEPPKG